MPQNQKSGRVAQIFCMAVANGAGRAAAVLAVEKFDQFGDREYPSLS